MTERITWAAYVPIHRIEAFRAAGWVFSPIGFPHHFYAVLASWPFPGDPVWPQSEAHA